MWSQGVTKEPSSSQIYCVGQVPYGCLQVHSWTWLKAELGGELALAPVTLSLGAGAM